MPNLTTSIHYTGWPDDEAINPDQESFFEAVEALDRHRRKMSPKAIAAEEERIHLLGVKAFPEIAAAYDEPENFGVVADDGEILEDLGLLGESDREYATRIDADRVTAEWRVKSSKRLDSGKVPITDSPLFGGPAQGGLF